MNSVLRKGWIVIICLSFFVIKFKIVVSGSMEPLISTGSLAIVLPVYRAPQSNDIILYQLNQIEVLHRVVEVKKDSYVTKGDSNLSNDLNPVSNQQVKGFYAFHIPLIGYFLFYLKEHLILFILLILLLYFWRKKR